YLEWIVGYLCCESYAHQEIITMWSSWEALKKSKTARFGIPMLLLVVGGSFGLREFTQIRYDAQKLKKKLDPELEARIKAQKNPVTLENEYERLRSINLDEWQNIRGPRPWEDSREYQQQQHALQDLQDARHKKGP
ncbi:COX16 protein, partial [Atractosteus spatula]|nr:COX16 protein [Atractosteus spatula]